MELTDLQKKDLSKFSLILNSLNMEDGVVYSYRYADEWEGLDGPYYNNRPSSEPGFLPQKIQDLFETIRDNFDVDTFYSEYYDNYNGSLDFIINASKKNLVVMYDYYVMEAEYNELEKGFQEADITGKTLIDPKFINWMKNKYGNKVILDYSGGGDDGYINNYASSDTGERTVDSILEDIGYQLLSNYYSGWEINEGSDGKIAFDFKNQVFTIIHNSRFEESVTETYMTFEF
jgi:hypothetical protein